MKPRAWFLLSLGFFLAAVVLWRLGEARRAEKPAPPAPAKTNAAVNNFWRLPGVRHSLAGPSAGAPALAAFADPRFPRRLHNAPPPAGGWFRAETAVLLRNAFIETSAGAPLAVPEHLRAAADPGSYIAQARGKISDAFRAQLKAAGAEVVSYIPNNAYLVRLTGEAASRLARSPLVQAVLPFEPYYKLDAALLELAVEQKLVSPATLVNVVAFPGAEEDLRRELAARGAAVRQEARTPFGRMFTVQILPDSLVPLARSSSVQGLEVQHEKRTANDLQNERVGIYTPVTNTAPYLNLTGAGVTVGVNDTGVEMVHPALTPRVIDLPAHMFRVVDLNGHGTHVAGIIAGSGGGTAPSIMPPGSPSNSVFRGKAPQATIYPINFQRAPDEVLQMENTTTNIRVSNNSWTYVTPDYNFNSAIWDAAVRDSDAYTPGDQPVSYVFAAGNSGFGNSGGSGGLPDTIESPANGKNVITVGAIEQERNITNVIQFTNVVTNVFIDVIVVLTGGPPATNFFVFITNLIPVTNIFNISYLSSTDSRDQVASYSSRGNVGLGVEGDYGRFKPDVVAPGSFVVSAAIAEWRDRVAGPLTNTLQYYISSVLDAGLLPDYRYESGTSFAAPAVSGMMVLMQEFFEQRLGRTNSPALSKALVISGARGLGVNGYDFSPANSVNDQGWGLINISNSLPVAMSDVANSNTWPILLIEQSPTNVLATYQSHTWQLDISDSGVGSTNQASATNSGLRCTLVWTDPPGNPAASAKLVNDLDLVVFDETKTNYYFGNNIPIGSEFTDALSAETIFGSNSLPNPLPYFVNPDLTGYSNGIPADFVNNVENVFIPAPLSPRYFISVVGRRVNVNAVREDTNNIVQDYALVIASANSGLTNSTPFTLTRLANATHPTNRLATFLTNGLTLLRQRVGANYELINPNNYNGGTLPSVPFAQANTNGLTNQWQFYVFSNITFTNAYLTNVAGSNVAFIVSRPAALSVPRNDTPDLDVYVSKQAGLTNLDPAVLGAPDTFRSVGRNGREFLLLTNGIVPGYTVSTNDVFYVGVKSEDQKGAEFSFTVLSTDSFGSETTNGFLLTGYPLPAFVPDGSPEQPGGVEMFFICPQPITIGVVAFTNTISHDNLGDLVMYLTGPDGQEVYLHNHSLNNGISSGDDIVMEFDDRFPETQVDGPGSLADFLGAEGVGLWSVTLYDNSPYATGAVTAAELLLERDQSSNGVTRLIRLRAGETFFDFADIPPYATNLTIDIFNIKAGGPGQVDLFVRRGALPFHRIPPDDVGYLGIINGDPRMPLIIDQRDRRATNGPPPLSPGLYFIAISNSFGAPVDFNYTKTIYYGLDVAEAEAFSSGILNQPLADNGLTEHSLSVDSFRTIVDVGVGVSINHPRATDLRLYLRDPSGNRALLFENRGGIVDGVSSTNLYANFTEDTTVTTYPLPYLAPIKFAPVPFQDLISPPQLVSANPYDRADDEAAVGLSIQGRGLYVAGNTRTNGGAVQDGLSLAYLLPLTNFTVGVANPVPATNWWATNWPGLLSNRVADVTFSGVAATTEGVYLGGQSRENFPATRQSNGGPQEDRFFFNAGCNQGSVIINYDFLTEPDRFTVYYGGVQLLDTGLINGVGTLTIPYGPGASSVVEIVVNEGGNLSPSTLWSYSASSDCAGAATTAEKAFIVKYPTDGPTGVTGSNGAIWFSRVFVSNSAPPYPFDGNERIGGVVAAGEFGVPFVYAAGSAEFAAGQHGFVLAKVDENGNTVWLDAEPVVPGTETRAFAVTTLSNGLGQAVISAGSGTSFGLEVPMLWSHSTAGARNFQPPSGVSVSSGRYYAVASLGGTNIVAVGTTDGSGGGGDSLVELWDAAGTLIWSRVFDALGAGQHDELRGVTVLGTRIYATGVSGSDAILLEMDTAAGTVISGQRFGATGDLPRGLTTDGNDLFVAGASSTTGAGTDAVLWKFKVKNFYQPEESLAVFRAGSAFGVWTLEILDTRAGPPGTNAIAPELVSWRLDFTYADDSVIPIFPSSVSQNFVHPLAHNASANYYAVEFPAGGAPHTVSVQSDQPVKITFNAAAPPAPQTAGNTVLAAASTNSLFTFAPDGPAAGQRYYLAVRNATDYETPNSVTLTVTPAATNAVAELANGVPLAGTLTNGARMNYYAFTVSANASGAVFELLGLDGDADLYLRQPASGPQALPGWEAFDYRSLNAGTRGEMIFLVTNAPPVPLTPGRWHLGVAAAGTPPVNYFVRATELTGQPVTEIELSAGVPVNAAVSAGNAPNSVFKFTVPSGAGAALFEAVHTGGRGQLLARQGAWPSGDSYDFTGRRAGAPTQQIVVRPGLKPGLTNIAGDWYLTLRNSLPATAEFTVRATLPSGGLLLGAEPPRLPAPAAFNGRGPLAGAFEALDGERYEVQYSENLLDWTTLLITNAPPGGQINFTDPGASNSPARYYRLLQVPQ